MTETVSHIALRRLNGPNRTAVFTALEGVTLGTDSRGCLHITSAATNFALIQTNDVVDLVDALNFRLLGRADRVINSGGVKVQPERIEQIIQEVLTAQGLQPLPRLFVAGLPDNRLGQRLTVFLEQVSLTQAQWAAVQETVGRQLGPYAMPKEWITLPTFAETPTGKLDQRATLARFH